MLTYKIKNVDNRICVHATIMLYFIIFVNFDLFEYHGRAYI